MWAVISDALAADADGDDERWRARFFELAHATLTAFESLDEAHPRQDPHASPATSSETSPDGDRDD